jgi:polyhydroxyalkanoate synthesis repressor PhaR
MRIIKKYSNRRLYDTQSSGYITLDELQEIIRGGEDVQVIDAKTGNDLTQATLAQIVVESGAARLLPTPLLTQMIRMSDDALAEFMQLYVAWAFQMYAETKKGLGKIPGLNKLDGEGAIGRLLNLNPFYRAARAAAGSPPAAPAEAEPPEPTDDDRNRDEVAELRGEIDELKKMIHDLAKSD